MKKEKDRKSTRLNSSHDQISYAVFCLKKKNISNNLTLHLKQLETEEQKTPKVSRRKEIIKIRSEINKKEMKETVANINKLRSWFLEKINKINKPLARLIKKKGKRLKSMELEMEKK